MAMSRLWTLHLIWTIISTAYGQTGDSSDHNLTESEYLTLEGGALLPYEDQVATVAQQVSKIRQNFPQIVEIKHNRKWIPGQVLTTKVGQEQIDRINNSSYGPLKQVERIDVMPFFAVTVLTFDKPYSPPALAAKLESEFGLSCTANTVYYEYEVDNITYRQSNSTYVFKKGTGMCKDDCPDRYLWEFAVDEAGEPTLVKEWVVPQDGQRVIIY